MDPSQYELRRCILSYSCWHSITLPQAGEYWLCAVVFHQNMSHNVRENYWAINKDHFLIPTQSGRQHLHKYRYVLACLSHMSVRTRINAKHDHTATEKKEIRSLRPSLPTPTPHFQSWNVSLYSLLFPTDNPSLSPLRALRQHPHAGLLFHPLPSPLP